MLKNAKPETGWLGPSLGIVTLIVAFRLALLPFASAEIFVDEAQYWLWGQELALGYYSKPPMIGWLLRAVTDLVGSDSAFWLRAPAALLHGTTALLLAGAAAELFGRRVAIAVAASYITLPMIAVGSFLISTDTVMFPFLAMALWAWVRVLREDSNVAALVAGVALGLAVMSKYAGLYYVLCAALAALFVPEARPKARHVLIAFVAMLVVISPNVIWNIQNGLSTLEHTMDNADWVRDPSKRAGLNLASLSEFALAQFAVFGPLCLAALLYAITARRWRRNALVLMLLWFSLPILLLVCGQALLSKAYANWAAAAYLGGVIVATAVLLNAGRWWLYASLTIGTAFTIALPLATLRADGLRLGADEPLLLERYVGRVAMSEEIVAQARAAGARVIVADDRDVLADLLYRLRGKDVRGKIAEVEIFAKPESGRAPNHYVQKYSYGGGAGPVFYVSKRQAAPGCDAEFLGKIAPDDGAFRQRPQYLWLLPKGCFGPL